MARFVFRLQSVLSLREKLENQKELEYAQALRQLEEERAKERALHKWKADCIQDLTDRLAGESLPIDPREVSRYNDFIDVLKERITAQQKVVHAAEQFAEIKRKELVEAMRARKTIEKLRENAYEEYVEEEKRVEQKQVDEVVSYKYSRL